MSNFLILFKGEVERIKKYNILTASFLVSFIWIGILYFMDKNAAEEMFPFFIFLDATSMSMLLVGVTLFFEKQEGTIKSLLVSPVGKIEYILAKVFSNIFINTISLVIVLFYAKVFKDININIIMLFLAVLLISLFHSLLGLILTFYSKDFTNLLIGVMKYAFIFMLPIVFEQIGIIKSDIINNVFYVLPTKASMMLLNASTGGVETLEICVSFGNLIVFSILLYFIVLKKFDQFAIRESGV
ncbi:ABC transporter permease [Herbivorax sp. ANBcel31]|uniref:ABC transporter permease n=1 Tax=Herbivorax sp. ANBcel31 TaxID=3069754 RepID=UPI0027B7EB44|nr:ABC transporter permease [Herbivorax sp. ANBcel31]MDQ2084839.1 ABC transporter permease [Herbivorax sp. ANBcel31]